MNKKILALAAIFGANVCSQQMFAIARPADIIINNTQEDVEYTIYYTDNNYKLSDISGAIPAGTQKTFYDTLKFSRQNVQKIEVKGVDSQRFGETGFFENYGIDFRYFTIENSPDNPNELTITVSRGTNYGVREDLESSPMVGEKNE